ncbi:OmpA family protein [Acidobacteria bacterium AH-259-D05]|nr:OmpA family protein [Acidobacteria bacterium AH-259-D05]
MSKPHVLAVDHFVALRFIVLRVRLLLMGLVLLLAAEGCANRPPVLSCVVEPTIVREGDLVTVRTNVTDSDKASLSFTWSATSGIGPDAVVFSTRNVTPQDSSAVYDSTGVRVGRYTIKAEVNDGKHQVSCSVNVMVVKNKQAPAVACNPSQVRVTEGQSTGVQARASDPNDDPLTYSWAVDGVAITNNQPSFEFGTVGRSIGAHRLSVTVTDADKMSANCEFQVTIDGRPNRNPTVALTLDKGEVYAGDRVTVIAQASDPDWDPVTYSWSLDGQNRPDTSSQIEINTRGLAGGRHSASVTVRDDRDGTVTSTVSFSVREKVAVQINRIGPDNLAKAQLDEIALKIRQSPRLRVTLTGHTDSSGSQQVNERVGQRRADAVKAYLVDEQHVDESRIKTGSAGESQPIADNWSPQGRRDNRRVEIELSESALKIQQSSWEELFTKAVGFAVQMAPYRTRQKSEEFRVMLQDHGSTAYVVEAGIPGSGRYYRVRDGPPRATSGSPRVARDEQV